MADETVTSEELLSRRHFLRRGLAAALTASAGLAGLSALGSEDDDAGRRGKGGFGSGPYGA